MRKDGSGLLSVLVLATAMAPLVTYAAAALSPALTVELRISAAQFGMFATISFISAALCSFAFSKAGSRLSAGTQLSIIFIGSAVSLVILGLADGFRSIMAAAILSGPGHALSNPLTNRIIVDRIGAETRTRWMGVKQSGVQCSQAFAGLAFPLAASGFGWRPSLFVLAAIIVMLLVWAYPRVADRRGAPAPAAPGVRVGGDAPDVAATNRIVRTYAAYALFSGAALQGTNVYLPLFAHDTLDLNAVRAGLRVAVAGSVGLCARIYWGRVMTRGVRAGPLLLSLALAACGGIACLIGASLTGLEPLLWLGTLIHGATAIGSNVIVMAGMLNTVPAARAGAASATVGFGMYLGFAFGPMLMGTVLALAHDILPGWILLAACYLVAMTLASRIERRHR